ncbi:MAG: hypothetical protein ACTSQE_12325 [Candidatus Heimdallarchaeaceae archaeon]
MVKVKIIEDEWFPCYEIEEVEKEYKTRAYDCICELSLEDIEEIRKIDEEFEAIQEKLSKIYKSIKEEKGYG